MHVRPNDNTDTLMEFSIRDTSTIKEDITSHITSHITLPVSIRDNSTVRLERAVRDGYAESLLRGSGRTSDASPVQKIPIPFQRVGLQRVIPFKFRGVSLGWMKKSG